MHQIQPSRFNIQPLTLYSRPLLLVLLLLALWLRVYRLNDSSLRGDEAATVHYSAMPITELWELARVTDPHPPLYYLMLHPWQNVFGESAWAMRLAGVMASVLSVAALYALARRTLSPAASGLKGGLLTPGLLAATLLAVNPFAIWLAQDIRSYPFFALFGLLSSGALWVALQAQSTRGFKPWLLYVLFTVVCFYMHYYTAFLIAFQGLFALVNYKKFWPQKWLWLGAQAAIGLLILPGIYLAAHFIGQAAGGIEVIPFAEIVRQASTALLTGFTLSPTAGLWVSWLLAPVWLLGLVILLRQDFTLGAFWGLFFAAPVIGVIALSIDRPFFKERFLVQAQPAFELLLAVGFLALWQAQAGRVSRGAGHIFRVLALFLFAALLYFNFVALSNYFTDPAYAKAPPWRLYHDYAHKYARPGDLMLTNFPEAAISYYSPNELPFRTIPDERDQSTATRLQQTAKTANQYQRIWFLPMLQQGFDEQGDVLNWLDRHADRVNQIFFPGYNLNLYLTPPTSEAAMIAQPVTFAQGIQLRGYQIFDKRGDSRLNTSGATPWVARKPGDDLTLSLYWLAAGPTPAPYTVFTHLIAADGFTQTSRDNPPVWGSYPTTAWQPGEKITDKYTLTLPQGMPPGDYRLRLGWYQSDTQARVPVLDNQGQPIGDDVILDVIVRVEN